MQAVGHVVQASIAGLRCSHQRRNDKLRQLHYAITAVHKGSIHEPLIWRDATVGLMLQQLGIESRLQLAITLCVAALIIVTTLGTSGGAPVVFFIYRTLLISIAILCTIGSRRADLRISAMFLAWVTVLFLLMLISVIRIPGSHFEGSYLWYRYAFFAWAFLSLANYARYQSAGWKAVFLLTIVAVGLVHLAPDLARRGPVVGFSPNNADYFATFLLIGVAVNVAAAIFAANLGWRITAAGAAGLMFFGIIRTGSRGATLASVAIIVVAAIRARGRIPRQVWLAAGLAALIAVVVFSPSLIAKFLDRNQSDPYNYARISIWKSSLDVIAQRPMLGVGFGQFVHVSKRFTFPVDGRVARYLKRIGIAHSEYLQHVAELGIPAALLLFGLVGYLIYIVWKRSRMAWPENRCFHEAAIFTAVGVGSHALVDNCWTIPVTAASMVVISLADPLPLRLRAAQRRWPPIALVFAVALIGLIYVHSVIVPGLGLYYNDRGHQAYERDDLGNAARYHLTALKIIPDHPVFLDNLGMVYLEQFLKNPEPTSLQLARSYFARAIQASPRSLEPRLHMEALLVRSFSARIEPDIDLHKAILENDTKLLEIDPYLPFPRKNLAGAYYVLGQRDRAFDELQRAIDLEPNYVPAYLTLASWYAERGENLESQRYEAIGVAIVNKYRNVHPSEVYESILLGRPEGSASGK